MGWPTDVILTYADESTTYCPVSLSTVASIWTAAVERGVVSVSFDPARIGGVTGSPPLILSNGDAYWLYVISRQRLSVGMRKGDIVEEYIFDGQASLRIHNVRVYAPLAGILKRA